MAGRDARPTEFFLVLGAYRGFLSGCLTNRKKWRITLKVFLKNLPFSRKKSKPPRAAVLHGYSLK
jgi:hypothetical protein